MNPAEKFLYNQFQKIGIRRDKLMSQASATLLSSLKSELPTTLTEADLEKVIEDRTKRGHLKISGDKIALTEKGLKAFEKV
jgi:hypothetical protein